MLSIDHLHKRFGDRVALDDVSFEVRDGETVGRRGGVRGPRRLRPLDAGDRRAGNGIAGSLDLTSYRRTSEKAKDRPSFCA